MYKRIKNNIHNLYYKYQLCTNSTVIRQRKSPLSIPIIIINYNQLFYLKQLVDFLITRGFEQIVIIDNKSTYPPLLSYYNDIKDSVTIEYMDDNYGHLVFFKNSKLQETYGKGFYVLTDADIIPNPDLPEYFLEEMLSLLIKYNKNINKVGFALDIDDIPDYYPLKNKVVEWEKQFWKWEINKDLYKANIDTTFALYKPGYPQKNNIIKFLRGIRMAGNFTAKHGGWYVNPQNYTDENLFYIKTVDKSSSWKLSEKGYHDNKGDSIY